MKASKRTLDAVKRYLQQEPIDVDELIATFSEETKLLRCDEMGDKDIPIDECIITWGKKEDICVLSDFIESYFDIFIAKICNVLDSFVGEEI